MEFIGIGLLLFGLLWAAAFGYAHLRAVGKAKAAENWPTATGQVVSAEVIEEESSDREGGTTTWYNPCVSYTYAAGGSAHQASRLRFGNYRCSTRKKAETALAPYRAGQPVTVRYNPERPGECVLETRKPGPIYLVMALFGLVFAGFGLFWNAAA